MEDSTSDFTFVAHVHTITATNDTLMVRIPPNIIERQELFRSLEAQLAFPHSFGWNWDALYDLLCDFSWIALRYKYIIIIHSDLPFEQKREDVRTYLRILGDAIGSWKPGEEHELAAIFPIELYEPIRAILQE